MSPYRSDGRWLIAYAMNACHCKPGLMCRFCAKWLAPRKGTKK